MNDFDIQSFEYSPKKIWLTHHVRQALMKALVDAVVGATAITLLIACSML